MQDAVNHTQIPANARVRVGDWSRFDDGRTRVVTGPGPQAGAGGRVAGRQAAGALCERQVAAGALVTRVKLTRGDSVITGETYPEGQAYASYPYVNIRIDGLDYTGDPFSHTFYDKDGWEREILKTRVELPKAVGSVVGYSYDSDMAIWRAAIRINSEGWLKTGMGAIFSDAEIAELQNLRVIYVPE